MTADPTPDFQVLQPAAIYRDPRAGLQWLERAFDFETVLVVEDAEGNIGHSETKYGRGTIAIGAEWQDPNLIGNILMRSPLTLGGANSQQLDVTVADADAHYRRAREAGATIVFEPSDQFYGARVYRALDPEGHEWSFSQPLPGVTRADMEAAGNITFERWVDTERAPAQAFRAQLFYRDPKAAIEQLEAAFGFETAMLIDNDDGVRAHLMFDGWEVVIGSEWQADSTKGASRLSPISTSDTSTQMVTPLVHSGIDVICERARGAGMLITQGPTDQFYGARTFRALDREMHLWVFQQPVRDMTLDEMSAASGLTLKSSL